MIKETKDLEVDVGSVICTMQIDEDIWTRER